MHTEKKINKILAKKKNIAVSAQIIWTWNDWETKNVKKEPEES